MYRFPKSLAGMHNVGGGPAHALGYGLTFPPGAAAANDDDDDYHYYQYDTADDYVLVCDGRVVDSEEGLIEPGPVWNGLAVPVDFWLVRLRGRDEASVLALRLGRGASVPPSRPPQDPRVRRREVAVTERPLEPRPQLQLSCLTNGSIVSPDWLERQEKIILGRHEEPLAEPDAVDLGGRVRPREGEVTVLAVLLHDEEDLVVESVLFHLNHDVTSVSGGLAHQASLGPYYVFAIPSLRRCIGNLPIAPRMLPLVLLACLSDLHNHIRLRGRAHSLLRRARIAGQYVIVNHSFLHAELVA